MAKIGLPSSFKLVTDVSQWGLLTWPAENRARLVACSLLATAVTVIFAFGCAHYIFTYSGSVFVNLLLITANMFTVLVTAFLQTVLIGDLFFSDSWREHVFLGRKPRKDDDEIDISAVNDHNAEFIVVLILLIAFNAVGLNFVTGDFFTEYHEEGYFQVLMRSDNPDDRIRALEGIADPLNNKIWEREVLRDLIIDAFDDPDSQVRRQAIHTAAVLDIIRSRDYLIDVAADHDDPNTRSEAAFTLGRLGYDPQARVVLEDLVSHKNPDEVRVGAFRGLAVMEDERGGRPHRSVPTILEHIDDEDEEVMAHAFWALARIRNSEPRERIREIIEEEEHGPRRCAALEAFKGVASADDATWARRQFQASDPDKRCDEVSFRDLNDRTHRVIWGDPLRVAWLKVVGNTDPYAHKRWLRRVIADPEESDYTRQVAAEIKEAMD